MPFCTAQMIESVRLPFIPGNWEGTIAFPLLSNIRCVVCTGVEKNKENCSSITKIASRSAGQMEGKPRLK